MASLLARSSSLTSPIRRPPKLGVSKACWRSTRSRALALASETLIVGLELPEHSSV